MGFPSRRRRQLGESTSPGFASPGTFRSQVFATSQRLAPPRTSWVCFTPLTSLGFCPPERSPRHVPWRLAGARCPLAVAFLPFASPRYPVNGGARHVRPRFGRRDLAADFRALLTCRARAEPIRCYSSWSVDALLDLVLSRVCRPAVIGPDRSVPSSRASAAARPVKARAGLHSRVLLARGRGILSLESAFPF